MGDHGGGHHAPTLESALLLRVPPDVATSLRAQLADGSVTSADGAAAKAAGAPEVKVKLTFTSIEGQLTLHHGGVPFTGQLVNMPAVIQVHKTFDQIHYYKAADIGQMLVVQPTNAAAAAAAGPTPSLNSNPSRPKNAAADAPPPIPIDWPHGLTPPTREIRPKRYERNTAVPYRIVKEVDTLLANLKDEKAVHTFELMEEEEEVEIDEEEEAAAAAAAAQEEEEEEEAEESGIVGRSPMDIDTGDRSSIRLGTGGATSMRMDTGNQTSMATGPRTGLATPMGLTSARLASPHLASPSPQIATPGFATGGATGSQTGPRQSMFAPSPSIHVTDADMADLELMPATAASAAAATNAAAASSINVDAVEHMFGTPLPAASGPSSSPLALAEEFLPASPPPAAPPTALELLRLDMAEVESRVEKGRKALTDAKNFILKKQAQQKLDAVLAEKTALEAKIAAETSSATPAAATAAPATS